MYALLYLLAVKSFRKDDNRCDMSKWNYMDSVILQSIFFLKFDIEEISKK